VPSKGVHINAIGTYTPDAQELDEETVKRAKILLDTWLATEAGDIHVPLKNGVITKESHIVGEIGQAFLDGIQIRNQETDITIFKSVGIAVQDVATAHAVLKIAESKNLGTVTHL